MNSPISFEVDAVADGDGSRIAVSADGLKRAYRLPGGSQQDYIDFYAALAEDFGTRPVRGMAGAPTLSEEPRWQPLLTDNRHPKILYGYGDPAVLKTPDGYYLLATSNDAPDAFPILRSADLVQWEPRGFVFPEGETPGWTTAGLARGDFWRPKWRGSAANIGSPTPPATATWRCRSGLRRRIAPKARGATSAGPCSKAE